jgi:ribosomal protein S27AE
MADLARVLALLPPLDADVEVLERGEKCPRCAKTHLALVDPDKRLRCVLCAYVLWKEPQPTAGPVPGRKWRAKHPGTLPRLRAEYQRLTAQDDDRKPPSQTRLATVTGIDRSVVRKLWNEIIAP